MEFRQKRFGERVNHVMLNEGTGEFVSIIPSCGAMLNGFNVKLKNDRYFELIDGYANEEDLINNIGRSFKGCKLSPFPNRINGGKYNFGSCDFQLDINLQEEGHAHHGLVYDVPFELVDSRINNREVVLCYNYIYDHDKKGYPFKYQLEIEYRFTCFNQLQCTTTVTNLDTRDMPVGDGWHPVFNAYPKVNDMYIRFSARRQLVLKDMIPNLDYTADGQFQRFSKIGSQSFDNCYELKDGGKAVFSMAYPALQMEVDVWQLTGKGQYNYLQLYTPDTRDSIAVEPVTCPADAFNNKLGLAILAPGDHITLTYGIEVSFLEIPRNFSSGFGF